MDATERSPYCNCLYFSANALARSTTQLAEEAFAPTTLSPSHAFILMSVAVAPGVSPGEVAQKMQLRPSTVTRLLDHLERRALLRRRNHGRSIALHPTKQGSSLAEEAKTSWRQLYQRYVALLGEAPARALTEQAYSAHEILSGIDSATASKKVKGESSYGQ